MELNMPLYILVDFVKDFDTANQEVPWNIQWKLGFSARICLAYKKEVIGRLKRRTLGNIWGSKWSETWLHSCPDTCSRFSVTLSDSNQGRCIQSWPGGNLFNTKLNLHERPEIFWYASSFLLMTLLLRHKTTKMHKKIITLFSKFANAYSL